MNYFALILWALFSVANCAVSNITCPKPVDIKPCECFAHSAQLYCNGVDFDDNHLNKIGPNVKTEHGLYHLLLIKETKLKAIPKHAFNQTKFERIFIENNHNLTHIDPEAFLGGNVTTLVIVNNPFLSESSIFDLARNLTPSVSIELNNNYIKAIPENAFHSNPNKSRIIQISLSNNTYNEKIGKNAFTGNPYLSDLWLDNNNINTIEDHGLEFTEPKTIGHQLTVRLNNNNLNSHAFNKNTIIIPRNTYAIFHFENNAFNDLSEDIFRPLAADGHKLVLNGNHFYCDCRMRWVLNKPQSNNIFGINCINHNNTDIFKLTEIDLTC